MIFNILKVKVKHLVCKCSYMEAPKLLMEKKKKIVPLIKAGGTGGLEGLVSLVPSGGSWEMFKGTSKGPGNSV